MSNDKEDNSINIDSLLESDDGDSADEDGWEGVDPFETGAQYPHHDPDFYCNAADSEGSSNESPATTVTTQEATDTEGEEGPHKDSKLRRCARMQTQKRKAGCAFDYEEGRDSIQGAAAATAAKDLYGAWPKLESLDERIKRLQEHNALWRDLRISGGAAAIKGD